MCGTFSLILSLILVINSQIVSGRPIHGINAAMSILYVHFLCITMIQFVLRSTTAIQKEMHISLNSSCNNRYVATVGDLTSYIDFSGCTTMLCNLCAQQQPTQINVRFATIAEMRQRHFPWLGMTRMSNTAHFSHSVFLTVHNIEERVCLKNVQPNPICLLISQSPWPDLQSEKIVLNSLHYSVSDSKQFIVVVQNYWSEVKQVTKWITLKGERLLDSEK